MRRASRLGGEAAAETIVWCAREGSQVIVKRTTPHTGSDAMCANMHTRWWTTREKPVATVIPEGWSIKRNEQEDNPLWKHCTLVHGGEKVDFTMTALGSFRSCLKTHQ